MFRSIRAQLLLVQMCALALLLAAGLAAVGQVRRLSAQAAQEYAQAAGNQASAAVTSILETVRISARSFCYSEPVQRLLTTQETDKLRLAQMYRQFSGSARDTLSANRNIVDLCLLPASGPPYVYGAQAPKVLERALDGYARSGGEGEAFTGFLSEDDGEGTEYYAFLLPVNSAVPGERFSEPVGLCLAVCRTSAIMDVMRSGTLEHARLAMAYDGGTRVLSLRGAQEGPGQMRRYPVAGADWEILQTLGPEGAFHGNHSALRLILAFVGIAALGIGGFVALSDRSISQPIQQLRAQLLDNARDPERARPVRIAARNELRSIAVEINRMMDEIAERNRRSIEDQERLYEAELLQRKLQFSALQSQINPHFLYNTLACIRGMALENGMDEIASVTVKMAKIFRYAIKGEEFVRMRDELAIVRRYVDIMNLRTSDKFTLRIEVAEEIQSAWIPRMLLQPLVENAIFHGLEGLARQGEVSVRGLALEEGRYAVEIRDNGAGIEPERLTAMRRALRGEDGAGGDAAERARRSGMGIGLYNIHRKMQLLLGEAYGLELDGAPDQGVCVRLTLPLLRQPPEP